LLFYGYAYFLVGDHAVNKQLERVWQVRLVTPWESLIGGIFKLGAEFEGGGFLYDVLNLAVIIVFGWLIWHWWWHRLPPTYFIYALITMLTLLTRQKEGDLWMSMSRYALALFPAFMLVAWRVKKPSYRTGLFALGAFFQTLFVILFLLWKWIA
jgi:hypothetical protein